MDGRTAEVFRPWTWPSLNGCIILAFAYVIVRFAAWGQVLFVAPAWLYVFFRHVLLMTVRVVVRSDELRWRTLLGSSAADLRLVAAVGPGGRWDSPRDRVIEIADGQRLRVAKGREFDRLVHALQTRVPDLEVAPERPRRMLRSRRLHPTAACAEAAPLR